MVACALMSSASGPAYQEVFRVLKEESPDFNMRHYMGDWDTSMRSAVRAEFPEALLYGCLFHYGQAFVRRASETDVGLASHIRRPGEILKRFLAFGALPLLPAANIRDVFEDIAEEALQVSPQVRAFSFIVDLPQEILQE